MIDFTVTGADQLFKFSKALKAAGRTELRKDLTKGMQAGAKPIIPATRAEARRRLPKSGGLAELVAKTPQRVQVRTGASTAGVRVVVGKNNSGARAANKGKIRHPVIGTDKWVSQDVPPGWFDDPAEGAKPAVTREVLKAMEAVADKVVRRG